MNIKIVLMTIYLSSVLFGWSGYDSDSGVPVEIEQGNLVRSGQDIEIYDYDAGEYRDVEVQSVNGNGSGAEVEVYDYDSGEYHNLDMD